MSHLPGAIPTLRGAIPDKFERLAINFSPAEIRTMVLDLMG